MATFNLGPHPRMITILNKNNLKDVIPLTDFLEALDKHEKGYSWKDLAPDGVSVLTWYELYTAYTEDERENRNGRQAEVERIERDRITDIRGHIEF